MNFDWNQNSISRYRINILRSLDKPNSSSGKSRKLSCPGLFFNKIQKGNLLRISHWIAQIQPHTPRKLSRCNSLCSSGSKLNIVLNLSQEIFPKGNFICKLSLVGRSFRHIPSKLLKKPAGNTTYNCLNILNIDLNLKMKSSLKDTTASRFCSAKNIHHYRMCTLSNLSIQSTPKSMPDKILNHYIILENMQLCRLYFERSSEPSIGRITTKYLSSSHTQFLGILNTSFAHYPCSKSLDILTHTN